MMPPKMPKPQLLETWAAATRRSHPRESGMSHFHPTFISWS